MKVRIQTDGKDSKVKVTDPETGKLIEGVFDIKWLARVGEVPSAELSVYLTEMDIITEAEKIVFCPVCKEKQHKAVQDGKPPAVADTTVVDSAWRRRQVE